MISFSSLLSQSQCHVVITYVVSFIAMLFLSQSLISIHFRWTRIVVVFQKTPNTLLLSFVRHICMIYIFKSPRTYNHEILTLLTSLFGRRLGSSTIQLRLIHRCQIWNCWKGKQRNKNKTTCIIYCVGPIPESHRGNIRVYSIRNHIDGIMWRNISYKRNKAK